MAFEKGWVDKIRFLKPEPEKVKKPSKRKYRGAQLGKRAQGVPEQVEDDDKDA